MQRIDDIVTLSYPVDFLVFSARILRPNSAVTAFVLNSENTQTYDTSSQAFTFICEERILHEPPERVGVHSW